MISVPRKKTGRPPGRPRAGEDVRAKDTEVRTLYIDVPGPLWNRLQDAVERMRKRTGFRSLPKADVFVKLMERALDLDEQDEAPKK